MTKVGILITKVQLPTSKEAQAVTCHEDKGQKEPVKMIGRGIGRGIGSCSGNGDIHYQVNLPRAGQLTLLAGDILKMAAMFSLLHLCLLAIMRPVSRRAFDDEVPVYNRASGGREGFQWKPALYCKVP